VESSLALGIFLMLLIGTIDLGRAVYQLNAVGEAAREIARVTSVHPGDGTLGDSNETLAVVETQARLVPGLSVPSYTCVDVTGAAVVGTCHPGSWVRVTVSSRMDPVLPLLVPFGPFVFTSSGSATIE
jgi:Flp pilus assembly protein TadG